MSLTGKVVAVTGVTSGLGRTVASVFAERGAWVFGCGRREHEGQTLSDEIAHNLTTAASGGRFQFFPADITEPAACIAFVRHVAATGGRLDVLINNAGGHVEGGVGPTTSVSVDAWDRTMDLNLRATFLCAREAIELMRDQPRGGVILNVASVQAEVGVAQMAAYNAAKAAVVQLSRTLAVEFLDENVRVNAIILGGVATGSLAGVRGWLADGVAAADRRDGRTGSPVQTADAAEATNARSPSAQQRSAALAGQSSEGVARALAALASDDAALITGASIAIDRAVTAGLPLSMAILDGARIAATDRQARPDS
jgi:2-keto-3-deoxy-L-fuconate dehydrogenase